MTRIKKYLAIGAAALLLAGAGTGLALAQAKAEKAEKAERAGDHAQEYQSLQAAKLTLADAIAKTEQQFPGARVVSGEFDMEDGKPAYALEVMDAKGEKEVTVDAANGQITPESDEENDAGK